MKHYARFKPSGVEWIGEIPEHWEAIRIKRLSPVKRGASPRPIDDQRYFDENGEFAWVRIADTTASERYLESTTQTLSELGSSLSVKRYPGDFFLSIAGTVGKPIITKIKCCIHDGFVWFPDLKINPEYLYYIFTTGLPYQGLGKWGTQLNLNTDTVGEISIPLPPVKEIEVIVRYLDRKTAEIDNLIAKKRNLIDLLDDEKAAIINHAVTKGLNPDAPMKDSGIPWFGQIPKHWKVGPVKRFLDSFDNIRVPLSSEERGRMTSRDYDYYGASGIIDKVESYIFDGDYMLLGEDGANLLTRSTSLVFKASGKFWVNNHAHVLRPKVGNLDYYVSMMETIDYTIWISGAAQPKLTAENLGGISILTPPVDEQDAIASFINDESVRIADVVSHIGKETDLLQEYRTALISEAVTGKIDVRGMN